MFVREKNGQASLLDEELCPDTPPPSSPCHEGSIEGSLGSGASVCAITAMAGHSQIELNVDDPYATPSPSHHTNLFEDDFGPFENISGPFEANQRAPTPPLPVTYNKHRCQTAESKGKGRARD
jgi:hypothetical protein